MTRALIFGVGGQDGSLLADLLLDKGYEVHGVVRRSSLDNLQRVKHITSDKFTLHQGDLGCPLSITRIITEVKPDEIYNEADQDSVGWSHVAPCYTMDITGKAVLNILETIRTSCPEARFFQPCSAMMFSDAALLTEDNFPSPQNEETRFNPQSPYACAKVLSYYLCRMYRQVHKIFASTAILYNHDSDRRSEHYLLHKICKSAVRIKKGLQEKLALGNLDSKVDIGYAGEYMEAAWKILQLDEPTDLVIGTGKCYSVGELVQRVFSRIDLSTEDRIVVDPQFYKTGIKGTLVADTTRAQKLIGWEPQWNIDRLIDLLLDEEYKK